MTAKKKKLFPHAKLFFRPFWSEGQLIEWDNNAEINTEQPDDMLENHEKIVEENMKNRAYIKQLSQQQFIKIVSNQEYRRVLDLSDPTINPFHKHCIEQVGKEIESYERFID